VDRDALEPPTGEAAAQPRELQRAPDGLDDPDAPDRPERLKRAPAAGADGDSSPGPQARLERLRDAGAQAPAPAFQVEDELCLDAERAEELSEGEPRRERIRKRPAVPQDRERPGGLEVAHLESAAEQVHVRLDRAYPEALGRASLRE
jgi:hypothetical protein